MLSDRTSARYFHGGPRPKRWCCRLNALCSMLVVSGLVELPRIAAKGGPGSRALFTFAMSSELVWWDLLQKSPEQRRAYLRYFCVNAIARFFPFVSEATRRSGLLDAHPAWADRSRRGEPVRRLLESVDPRRKNREHAKHLGFEPSLVSGWKTARRRPSRAEVAALAGYLHRSDGSDVGATSFMLFWHYALSDIADAIRPIVGDDGLAECASVVTQTLSCMAGRGATVRVSNMALAKLLVIPLWRHSVDMQDTIIEHAIRHGADPSWRTDVLAIGAMYRGIAEPDEVVRRAHPRHRHAPWRLARKDQAVQVRFALRQVRDGRSKRGDLR